MGIDGFSMSNLGLHRNLTSAQLANEAEDTARQSLENQMADVDGVGKREKVGKKDEDAAFNGMVPFIPADEQEQEDEEQPSDFQGENDNVLVSDDDEDSEEDVSNYHFRYNRQGMIEISNSETKEILKTITPEQARKALLNIDEIPGFLVNKKI